MADALGFRLGLPMVYLNGTSTITPSNHTIDGSTDAIGWIFQAQNANPITKLGFRYGARTGTPPAYTIGLEGVSTSTGYPDGTYKQNAGNDCKVSFTPPADATWDGAWKVQTLDFSYTPSRGELLAMTIRTAAGDASNYSTFTYEASGASVDNNGRPYTWRNTGGTQVLRAILPIFGVYTASETYGNIWQSNYTTATSSTVGHRVAMKFTLPAGHGSSFKVLGFRSNGTLAAAGKAPIAGLWSASGAIQTVTIDADQTQSAGSARRWHTVIFDEATLTALDYGTAYYIGFEVADAASGSITLQGNQHLSSTELLAEPGGQSFFLSTYNGSAWTDDQTVRPYVELILDDITEPSAGGGLLVHGGMTGGMRG